MKVLLIHPPSREVYDKFARKSIDRLPIGLAYIAAVTEKQGHNTIVIDAEAEKLSLMQLYGHIYDIQPDVLGITCTTPLFPISAKILARVKELIPVCKTILGGPHINALPGESLNSCHSLDYVIFGEGEASFGELLTALQSGAERPKIPGVGFRNGKGITLNSPRKAIEDLNQLPFPARHLFPMKRYHDPDRYNKPYTLMVTSRGCPYNCIFCGSSATWGRKVRFRSAENVLAEIDEVVNRYGVGNITFTDDTFTLGKRRVIDICRGITDRGYKIKFLCSSRVNTIDEERLDALAEAGCIELSFGIESGDEDILKTICKNIRLDEVIPKFELVKRYGIRVHSSYILGNPGDTHDTIEKTIQFAIDSGTDAAQFSISTPYPGTALWDMSVQKGKLKDVDFSRHKWYYSVVANLSEVSDEALIEYQRNAYKRFEEARINSSFNKNGVSQD
ncbi:MAG: radical SAM protein [candidate division Zixibacteria bacterium]|nr:radical SAM protein [candidate division Zixibacteria bacterium]